MNIQGDFIEPDDLRWLELIGRVSHDFYHLPDYTTFCSKQAGGRGCAYLGQHDDATILIPLVLRDIPRNLDAPSVWQDAMSPYGYASPLTISGKSPHSLKELWRAFVRCCRDNSIVAAFIRFHPLLPMPSICEDIGVVVEEGETIFIDLTETHAELLGQIRENHRRDIRRLRKNGFRTVIDKNDDNLVPFITLYHETMHRAGAAEEYFFDENYFHDLAAINNGNIYLCTVMAPGSVVAAAGMFFCCGEFAQFHLSGTVEEYLPHSPTKLMFDDMSRWAKERGCRFLHLGGGVGCRNDSLFNFKAGFSDRRASYHSLRLICAPDCYAHLTAQTLRSMPTETIANGFFPAYRQSRFT